MRAALQALVAASARLQLSAGTCREGAAGGTVFTCGGKESGACDGRREFSAQLSVLFSLLQLRRAGEA